MSDLTATITNALAAAREDGVLDGGGEGDETPVETNEEEVAEGGDEEAEAEVPAEGADEEEEAEEEPKEGDDEAEEEEAEEEAEEEPADEDDPDFGPKLDKNGKENKLPHSRMVKIRDGAVKREIGRVTDVIGTALGYKAGQVTTENITAALEQVQGYRQYYEDMQGVEPMMRTDGKAFIALLASKNPAQYARYAEIDAEGYEAPKGKAGDFDDANEPQPDVDITLPDGSKGRTFSQKGMKTRDEWLVGKAVAMATKEMNKRFGPIEQERNDKKKKDEEGQVLASSIKDLISEAREDWDGFKEKEADIRKAYDLIPKSVPFARALRQAYQKVVVEGLKATKATVRKKVIEDGNKAAKAKVAVKGKVLAKKEVIRDEDGQPVSGLNATIRGELAKARADGRLK